MDPIDKENLKKALEKKGYQLFTRPFELNIVGVRASNPQPDVFQDALVLLFLDDAKQDMLYQYPITTDPDTYWLEHPMEPNWTAILVPDQYLNGWYIREHRDKYLCLGQRDPVKVYRDNDRNGKLDFDKSTIEEGQFDIEIHKGSQAPVEKWSAGCQVFQHEKDFDEFMPYCNEHKNRYGNTFTYTLLDQVDIP